MESPYLFTTCQAGAEKALKSEIARVAPDLRFAFSRPGFVTFKSPVPLKADFELNSVFARAYGLSLGRWDQPSPELVLKEAARIASETGADPKIHLWERDFHAPGEEPKGFVRGALEARAREQLKLPSDVTASPGDWVLDVVIVEENQWWYGIHRHHRLHSRHPGARAAIPFPEEAPSRAYLKLEEAIARFEVPLHEGDTAVEVGSAPGGASYALVQRKLHVVGIDPAAMDPYFRALREDQYFHIPRGISAVQRQDLPRAVHWFLLDMNVAPRTALKSVLHLLPELQDTLLGAILTFKLNEWSYADEIPSLLEDIRKLGFARIRATQLPSNAREFCVYALTRKGVAR